jgi:hypothetical protein
MNQIQAKALHSFYLVCREMIQKGIPRRGVQRSFEELVYSIVDKNSWRPTHISMNALKECINDNRRAVQRAHGAMGDRKDRFVRTLEILEGPVLKFETWWDFFLHHDKTILITRQEHGSGKKFTEDELIPTPDWEKGMFENSGFNVRIRKRVELVWMKERFEEITKHAP